MLSNGHIFGFFGWLTTITTRGSRFICSIYLKYFKISKFIYYLKSGFTFFLVCDCAWLSKISSLLSVSRPTIFLKTSISSESSFRKEIRPLFPCNTDIYIKKNVLILWIDNWVQNCQSVLPDLCQVQLFVSCFCDWRDL